MRLRVLGTRPGGISRNKHSVARPGGYKTGTEGSKRKDLIDTPRSALPSDCLLRGVLMCVTSIDIAPGPQTVKPEDVRQDDSGWTSTYY